MPVRHARWLALAAFVVGLSASPVSAQDEREAGFDLTVTSAELALAAAPVAQEEPPAWEPLEQINAYRWLAGAPAASYSLELARSAEGQVAYYDRHRRDPSMAGMGLHNQREGAEGFTGTTMGNRARNAGYTAGSVTENAGFGGIDITLNWAIHTVNHRLPLIHPSVQDVGFATSPETGFTIIDVGLRRTSLTIDLPSVFPGDGATGVPRTWDGGETPNPAPGIPRPLGYPITVAFGVNQRVEWRSLQLLDPSGEQLEVSTPKTDWMRAAAIIPHRPLQPSTAYTAWAEAIVDGKRVAKEWVFTTGS